MNRIVTLAGILTATVVSAQLNSTSVLLRTNALPGRSVHAPGLPTSGGAPKALNIVFNEDFDFGLSGNSGFGPWTTGGPDGGIWLGDTNGPNGDFSDPSEIITSTTAGNGFVIFDSNLSNNGGLGNNRVGYLISPVLDLSATPDVQLKFEHAFRWCCSGDAGHWLDVSIDGGASWPFRVDLSTGALNDPMTTNWDIGTHTKWIDISEFIAGNASNVAFRFAHEDATTPNISHYFWQIDDVQLIETPAYDPQFTLTQYNDFIPDLAVLSGNTVDLGYSVYPYSQLHELTLKGKIRNGGTSDLTNVQYTVNIDGPGAPGLFNQTATLGSLPRYAIDSLQIPGFTPPATAGDYTVDFTVATDSLDEHPADNTATLEFSVHPFIYSMDDGAMNGRSNTQAGDEFEICNKFFIHQTADAYAVNVGLARRPTSAFPQPSGQSLRARIYDGTGAWIAETDEYFVDSTDLIGPGGTSTVPFLFSSPLTLAPDEYLVCLHYAFGGDPVWVATSGISELATSIDARPNVQDGAAQFFIQDNTPMIRLNFDASIGIEENDVENGVGLGQSIPNPARDEAAIPYSLTTAARVTVTLHDVSGKRMLLIEEGAKPAGVHRVRIDTSALPEGVYFYTLTTADVQLSRRLTVVH